VVGRRGGGCVDHYPCVGHYVGDSTRSWFGAGLESAAAPLVLRDQGGSEREQRDQGAERDGDEDVGIQRGHRGGSMPKLGGRQSMPASSDRCSGVAPPAASTKQHKQKFP
jgi:hypothetical protein